MSTLASVFGYGLLSARAAASVAGRFYYATDTTLMYRDNGSSWDSLAVGVGSIATDTIWDAAGDLVQGTGANTAAKLSAGLTGQLLTSAGAAAANAWKYPPGYEFDYVEKTSNTTVNATTSGTANTIVTANAVTYDGSQIILVEYYHAQMAQDTAQDCHIVLFDGSTALGDMAYVYNGDATTTSRNPMHVVKRLTPTAASHTYSVRAYVGGGTWTVVAGAGGAGGTAMPCFIRQTKVSGGA